MSASPTAAVRSFLRATWLLWRTRLVRALLTRHMLLVVLGACIPPAVAFVVLHAPKPPAAIEAFLFPSWILVMQLFVPLASVIAGSAVVAQEREDRTLTYLVTRPIPRPAILLGRWLATATWLVAVTTACVLGLAFVVQRSSHALPPGLALEGHALPVGLARDVLGIALLGVLAYSALFAAFSTFLRHPLIVGLAFVFAIEGLLANLPGRSQAWTLQFQLRSLLLGTHAELWSRVEGVRGQSFDPPGEAAVTLALVLLGALLVGALVIRRKQYVSAA